MTGAHISVLVTNQPPDTSEDVPQPLLELFRAYARKRDGVVYPPFRHQAEVFRLLAEDREVFLVAGTAAGKTLAVAVPLFHKLATGRIRKVLLMYPTIALMDDQRQVMETLAEITGVGVGQLQGGMSRSKMVAVLNKPLVVATPDVVYWFFRKNVKYSGLLVYSLALVDEFVLDEAHLFNGLMLQNLKHLWKRIGALARCLGRTPRLHILTATPTGGLKELAGGAPLEGRSKCSEVSVEFRPAGPFDRLDQFTKAISEALEAGARKVLVVCNSAGMAHRLFEKCKVGDTSRIPVEHRLRFGRTTWGVLAEWLDKAGVERKLVDALGERLFGDEEAALADIPAGTRLDLPLEDVVAHATEVLEGQCWQVKRAVWERSKRVGETWESLLNNRPLPCAIVAMVRQSLQHTAGVEGQQALVDQWLTDTMEKLANVTDDPIRCEAGEFAALTEALVSAGLDKQLALLLTRRLRLQMRTPVGQGPGRALSERPVYLRWLDWALEKDQAETVRAAIRPGLESGELALECRHIGLCRGTQTPVIVYSGSMAKQARTGLVDLFSRLDSAVLISTSAVEVGVDFRADALITEECEANSFLQRFGRVGRHGLGSVAIVFVSGDTYAMLDGPNQATMSRDDFSAKLARLFPRRNYAAASKLLDASHYLVNEQLGRVGERLNAVPCLARARPMADQLRGAGVQMAFGLRTTMPEIVLRDGVGKDPFYVLRYVDEQDLRSADSPFEVARAKTWFTSLIFQKPRFNVVVDLVESLKASQHMFIRAGSEFRVWSQPGVGMECLRRIDAHFQRLGSWVKWFPGNFILLHGDVYLSRIDRGAPYAEPARDSEQSPLLLPAQTYLVLWGWTGKDDTRALLQGAGVADWEELYYDWDRLEQEWSATAMVILERAVGACFAAYEELVSHASRRIQG